jgi:hypothetical protein
VRSRGSAKGLESGLAIDYNYLLYKASTFIS